MDSTQIATSVESLLGESIKTSSNYSNILTDLAIEMGIILKTSHIKKKKIKFFIFLLASLSFFSTFKIYYKRA
jgi:hypothetical protein